MTATVRPWMNPEGFSEANDGYATVSWEWDRLVIG